jgi:two-component system LytT family response regulator
VSAIRILIADDERPARSLVKAMLAKFQDVELLGEAQDGAEAVEMIERLRPDLVLLDLQMPEMSGLDVVRLLPKGRSPLVIFVTAYDEYAVKAFELNAVDYLLKPVDPARLRDALNRAAERLEQAELVSTAVDSVRNAGAEIGAHQDEPLRRIPVRKREAIILVPVEQVASIIADGDLLHIHTTKREKHTITSTLKELEQRLPHDGFIRLGRGTLASVAMIERITPMPGGTYVVTLSNGQEIAASRIQSRVLKEKLLKL